MMEMRRMMKNIRQQPMNHTRRDFIRSVALGAAFFTVPGAFAQELVLTPSQTQGPFYPDRLPLDTDNDLLIINDNITPAVGEITHLSGRVLNARGEPIRNAVVEIWQVDNNGAYIHSGSMNRNLRDTNFQGFGRFLTGFSGEYYFRTVKPVIYPGRTRHIHFAVYTKGREKFTTQCYVKGEPRNSTDGVLNGIRDMSARNSVIIAFDPVEGSRIGELAARFDIVLDVTPGETVL
jgi:protocatechuate 3,4-dioxygenase beta subunit